MKYSFLFLVLTLMSTVLVSADVVYPTVTKVFFEKSGQPYNEKVNFAINCYGQHNYPQSPELNDDVFNISSDNSSKISKVFSRHGTASHYGAEIEGDYYMNYIIIDYCDLEAQTPESNFTFSNYSSSPIDFSTCVDGEGLGQVCEFRVDLTTKKLLSGKNPRSPSVIPYTKPVSVSEVKDFLKDILCLFTSLFGGTC